MSMAALALAIGEVAEVVRIGDEKHGFNAWKRSPERTYEIDVINHAKGAERHLRKRIGTKHGPAIRELESGKRHLAHVAARALIALQLEIDRENGL